jgi:hypothetical protein
MHSLLSQNSYNGRLGFRRYLPLPAAAGAPRCAVGAGAFLRPVPLPALGLADDDEEPPLTSPL